jgi:hypothetical protein
LAQATGTSTITEAGEEIMKFGLSPMQLCEEVAKELLRTSSLPALLQSMVENHNVSEAIIHARLSAHGIPTHVIEGFVAQYRVAKIAAGAERR